MEKERKDIELFTQIKALLAPMELNVIYAAYQYGVLAEFSHRHHCHHLIIVTDGEAKIHCSNDILILKKGDLLFIPCNVWHHFMPDPNVAVECFILSFELTVHTDLHSEIKDAGIRELYDIYQTIKQYNTYALATDFECIELAFQTKKDFISSNRRKNLYLLSDYIRILTAAFENLGQNTTLPISLPADSRHNIAIEIAMYLNNHYTENIHIEDIAKLYNFTPRHVHRIFNEYFGTSISYSLMLIRLDAARNLLSTTDLSVQEIALKCGFISARALTRKLKEVDNKIPSDYRNSLIYSKTH